MGADGGTIPKRCELVPKKKKTEKIEKAVKNAVRWKNCQVSQQPLKKPIIACRFGRLYNKDAVIEAILNKTIAKVENTAHIKGTKDFQGVAPHRQQGFQHGRVKGDGYQDLNVTPYICPITTAPMNGNQNFVVNWKCGCVFSEKALNEIKTDACHGCNGPISADDMVVLYPDDELLEKYKERLVAERKAAKEKKAAIKAEPKEASPDDLKNPSAAGAANQSKFLDFIGIFSKSKKPAAPKRKMEIAPLKGASAAKKAVSIQDDPNTSAAYKNLFTSCEAARNKPEQHWVTHNPLFY
ncbi:unnamed protein product, partial [Mesorhabditis spiculigera]